MGCSMLIFKTGATALPKSFWINTDQLTLKLVHTVVTTSQLHPRITFPKMTHPIWSSFMYQPANNPEGIHSL